MGRRNLGDLLSINGDFFIFCALAILPLMGKKNQYRSILRTALLWPALLLMANSGSAQFTNISGVVNTYYSIVEVIPAKACVRVSNTSGLSTVNKVLIIQMKGATISTSNAGLASWGDTTSLNNAGNYEINYICAVRGDSVFMVYQLASTYTPSNGKVQLVAFAEYQNANVIDSVKAAPWNFTSGTGGVIAIDVIDTLQLNAPIYADGAGYKGGTFFHHSASTCGFFTPVGTAYAYDATTGTNDNGAYKGEGVGDPPSNMDGGKGAPANGGGGGNNHNNSGAGGANLSAGGRGGGNSSSGPTGCNTSNNMGIGGKALQSWNGKKVFVGGGGGAGHNNNAVFTLGGGNGGGIIFIQADTLIGNGHKITANGAAGGQSQGDGAGGGGAGGTIVMDVNRYLGAALIQVNGGAGGNSNDVLTPGRCFGGGGGGSGGAIYFSGTLPAVTTNNTGGTAGVETNRDAGCAAAVPGLNGNNGQVISNYTINEANIFASSCGLSLPARFMSFTATQQEQKAELNWRILNAELVKEFKVERKGINSLWQTLGIITATDNREHYSITDHQPIPGANFYRVALIEINNAVNYSGERYIYFSKPGRYTIYPNPARDKITVSGKITRPVEFRLSSVNGDIVLKQTLVLPSTIIQFPSLAPGVYIVRIDDETTKLLIR